MSEKARAKTPWKSKQSRSECIESVVSAFIELLRTHPHGYLLRVGRMTADFLHSFRQLLGDNNPRRYKRWQFPAKKHILQRVIVTMGKILTKGAMRLWRQRNSTAIQLYATMAHLPPEVLSTLPIIPHAEARLSKEKFQSDQQLRDDDEGLTPELLGLLVQPLDPPEESTEPTLLPQTEIQRMSSAITGIKVQKKLRSFKKRNVTSSSSAITTSTEPTATSSTTADTSISLVAAASTDYSNSVIAHLILRVIRWKRKLALDKITSPIPATVLTVMVPSDDQILRSDISTVLVVPSEHPIVTVDPSTITSSARVAGGMRIQSLPKQSSKR